MFVCLVRLKLEGGQNCGDLKRGKKFIFQEGVRGRLTGRFTESSSSFGKVLSESFNRISFK